MRIKICHFTKSYTGIRHVTHCINPVRFPTSPTRIPHSRGFITGAPRRANPSSYWGLPPRARNILAFEKWSLHTQIGVLFTGACFAYYLFHLERAPVTRRIRFIDVSPGELQRQTLKRYNQLLDINEGKVLPQDHALVQYVRRVVGRVLEGSQLGHLDGAADKTNMGTPGDTWFDEASVDLTYGHGQMDREWRVLVIKDDNVVNASAVNGTIIVYTGLLPLCIDESGLAAAVGHEIGHIVARHAAERLSSFRALTLLSSVIEVLFPVTSGLPEFVSTYAFYLPNSRAQELEADKIGMDLIAKGCYDPRSVPDLQRRLASLGPQDLEFLSSHPSSERRAQILETYLPEAYSLQASSSLCGGLTEQLIAFRDATSSPSEWTWSVGADDK